MNHNRSISSGGGITLGARKQCLKLAGRHFRQTPIDPILANYLLESSLSLPAERTLTGVLVGLFINFHLCFIRRIQRDLPFLDRNHVVGFIAMSAVSLRLSRGYLIRGSYPLVHRSLPLWNCFPPLRGAFFLWKTFP
jgi:hypothetical protein